MKSLNFEYSSSIQIDKSMFLVSWGMVGFQFVFVKNGYIHDKLRTEPEWRIDETEDNCTHKHLKLGVLPIRLLNEYWHNSDFCKSEWHKQNYLQPLCMVTKRTRNIWLSNEATICLKYDQHVYNGFCLRCWQLTALKNMGGKKHRAKYSNSIGRQALKAICLSSCCNKISEGIKHQMRTTNPDECHYPLSLSSIYRNMNFVRVL